MRIKLILIASLYSMHIASCTKSNLKETSSPTILDSVVMGNKNLKFIYDANGRVIKERLVVQDTLKMENTFFYNGNDSSPYMKSHKSFYPEGDHLSYFRYNSNGDKVYDSTSYIHSFSGGQNWQIIVEINYSVPGRIAVLQKVIPQQTRWSDTVYINNIGNIDSIRYFYSYAYFSIPNPVYLYRGSTIFQQYNSIPNYFRTLSISKCKFYQPEAFVNPANILHTYNLEGFQRAFDYFSANYFTQLGGIQKQIQFNSSNIPVNHISNPNYYLEPIVRYVYR